MSTTLSFSFAIHLKEFTKEFTYAVLLAFTFF